MYRLYLLVTQSKRRKYGNVWYNIVRVYSHNILIHIRLPYTGMDGRRLNQFGKFI